MSSLTPDEMRERFESLPAAKQVEFLGKLQAGMELMATLSATVQNAVVTLYPVFERMAEMGKDLESILLNIRAKEEDGE